MSDTIKGVKIKELPEKDTMADTDILVVEDSEATKQISAEAMKTYFTADLADEIQKLKDENAELSDNLYKSVEFYNGDEWLETVVVMRGDDAVYTGDMPVNVDNPDISFSGWNPEPINIKENMKCYAQYDSSIAFAFYSTSDNSLNFYYGDIPKEETVYNGKTVTNIYTGFDTKVYSSGSSIPWYENRKTIAIVNFNESFAEVQPVSTAFWFYSFSNCTEINGLKYLDTSFATSMYDMFYQCNSLTILDVSEFDTSSVTDMGAMFYMCNNLITLDLSGFNTRSVTNMFAMFYCCNSIVTIYSNDSLFITANVTSSSNMFGSCTKLVGGNGTVYSASKVDVSMAHIDTADNPGYFTAK